MYTRQQPENLVEIFSCYSDLILCCRQGTASQVELAEVKETWLGQRSREGVHCSATPCNEASLPRLHKAFLPPSASAFLCGLPLRVPVVLTPAGHEHLWFVPFSSKDYRRLSSHVPGVQMTYFFQFPKLCFLLAFYTLFCSFVLPRLGVHGTPNTPWKRSQQY